MSILIFSEKSSPRLEYILDFVFREVLLCEYETTTNLETFKASSSAKLNYSDVEIDNIVQIVPHTILFETNILEQGIDIFQWNSLAAFFQTSNNEISFDIFAASFYLITRYEEYLTDKKDEFERFPHVQSLAFKNGFLNIPLVDLWLLELKSILQKESPDLVFDKKEFTFLPTYDIDIAYSYKHKGLLRNTGGALKDLVSGNFRAIRNRLAVLNNSAQDPFDSFDFLDKLHKENKLSPIYFLLLGSGGKLDKNLSVKNAAFKVLIKRIAHKYEVGIHPSYRSNDENEELNIETQRLNVIASIQTKRSRQHYIRFALPSTYQNLLALGITEDYSMGYGSINGFRASTSNPFYWFDLSKNEITQLRIYPFCFMECNSFFEQKQSIAKTQIEIREFVEILKKTNGSFISIWHNFSLGTDPLWKDWKKLYEYQIQLINKNLP